MFTSQRRPWKLTAMLKEMAQWPARCVDSDMNWFEPDVPEMKTPVKWQIM